MIRPSFGQSDPRVAPFNSVCCQLPEPNLNFSILRHQHFYQLFTHPLCITHFYSNKCIFQVPDRGPVSFHSAQSLRLRKLPRHGRYSLVGLQRCIHCFDNVLQNTNNSDLFCQSTATSTGPPVSAPLPPNRKLTAESHEKKIYTPRGGEITIVKMSAETLKVRLLAETSIFRNMIHFCFQHR